MADAAFVQIQFAFDPAQNVQVNTGLAGVSGGTQPTWATTAGGTVNDGTGIVWTNQGNLYHIATDVEEYFRKLSKGN